MYQKILLAYNGSAHSNVALRQAAELARLTGARLYMLGIVVMSGGMALAQSSSSIDTIGLERERIMTALEAAAHKLGETGLSVTFSVQEGEPASQIVGYAHRIKADLVVLGNTERGVLARWFQGSVGAKLLSQLPCSLLIAAAVAAE